MGAPKANLLRGATQSAPLLPNFPQVVGRMVPVTAATDEEMEMAVLRLGTVMYVLPGANTDANIGWVSAIDRSIVGVPKAQDSTYAPPTATLRTVSCNVPQG